MADQVFAVNSGFYDAVNSDRTYSADDMNRPYKRVVSNGVFATPKGTKSTDLQVVSAGNGMEIIVKKGDGIFADKWFENSAAINITVPNNTSTVPRIDSVLVQIDKRTSGRVGNIVYRTGTPSSNPSAPSINTVSNVIEYRLANVRVNAGTTGITNSMITDRRGSADCPWVTSLIYQVDTSTLYDQWAAAYEEYFEAEKAIWDEWYSHLTEELDVSMSIMPLENTVVTVAETSSIPIGISRYNSNTDLLEVYINGMRAIEGTQYTIDGDTSISLTDPLDAGQTVNFVVLKSVIMGNEDNMYSLLEALDAKISAVSGGIPTVVSDASDMTDTDKIYILTTDSMWYYYSLTSSDWVAGGVYGGVPTDTTLTQPGMAADAHATGVRLSVVEETLDDIAVQGEEEREITIANPTLVWSQGNINTSGTINYNNLEWIHCDPINVSNLSGYTVVMTPMPGYRIGAYWRYKDGTGERSATHGVSSGSIEKDLTDVMEFMIHASPSPAAQISPAVGDDTLTLKIYTIERVKTHDLEPAIRVIAKEEAESAIEESRQSDPDIIMPCVSVFPTFGVVGDSYSSGAIHFPDGAYVRRYDLSWCQQMARKYGIECTNYTYSGIGTTGWLTNQTYGLPKLLSDPAKDLYILALGINDYTQISNGTLQLGTIADMTDDYTQSPPTFCGNYNRIIGNIKAHAPNAMIVQLSYLRPTGGGKSLLNPVFEDIAEKAEIPYIRLDDDGFFTSDFYRSTTQVDGHPTAVGYAGMCTAIGRLLSKCMRDNPTYFGMIGHP